MKHLAFMLTSFFALVSCGISPEQSKLHIVNGIEAKKEDFPYVVKIEEELGGGAYAGCTASYISPSLVLTAAHCIEGQNTVVTVEGTRIKRRFKPSGYLSQWWNYDIAIVDMGQDMTTQFRPIACDPPAKGDEIFIVGYGKTDFYNDTNNFSKLHFGTNKVANVYQGRISFDGSDRPRNPANGRGVVNALGDSGGPMVASTGYIVGVSSSVSAVAPGQTRTGNYTNVNYKPIRDWMRSLERNYGLKIPCK